MEREDALYAETLGALDMLTMILWIDEDTARAVAPSPLRPDILREESNGYSGN
jgi:hypothetical protein